MGNVVVVSLASESARRQHIDNLFSQHEIGFEYFDAINKSQVADILEKYNLTINNERLSLGEVGCYLSHYSLWHQVVEQNMPYVMIFEDDIYFSKYAGDFLKKLDWLPEEFDVIKLETMYEKVMMNRGFSLTYPYRLRHMKSSHMGLAGYILSYDGAKKLLALIQETGIDCPIDHVVFDKLIEQNGSAVYQLSPALCIQDKVYNVDSILFESRLEDERVLKAAPFIRTKLSCYQKIKRESIRLLRQVGILYANLIFAFQGYTNKKVKYKD